MPPTSFAGQLKNDSPQNGAMQCNSTFSARQMRGKSVKFFDATDAERVAQNSRLTKRGLMRFWIADLILDY
jgi:hypothetical protein